MVTNRRRSTLELLTELLERLAHIRISHMHFTKEMICQSSVVIKATQICTAHVADLQFLMTGRTRGILKVLQFPLIGLFLVLGGADLMQFVERDGHGTGLAEDGDFEKSRVDGFGEIRDLFELQSMSIHTPYRQQLGKCLTKLLVCRISSGVFSNRRWAESILRSQSSMYFCISRI